MNLQTKLRYFYSFISKALKLFSGTLPLTITHAIADNAQEYTLTGQSSQAFVTIDGTQYAVPSGYTVLDYAQNGSATKVNTRVTPTVQDCEYYCRFYAGTLGTNYIFQSRASSTETINGLSGSQNGNLIAGNCNGTQIISSIARTIGHIYQVKFTVTSAGAMTLYVKDETDGTEASNTGTVSSFTAATSPIYLFGNNAQEIEAGQRIYEAYYKEAGEMKVNVVPMKNSSDTVGYYDFVSNTFLTATSGSLTAGTEAPCPERPVDVVSVGDPILPSGYTQLESITFPSGAYLTTNIIPTTYDYEVTFKGSFSVITGGPNCAYGYMDSSTLTPRYLLATWNATWLSSPNSTQGAGVADTNTHTFVTEVYEDSGTPKYRFSVDGTVLLDNQSMNTTHWTSNTLPFYIGARNNGDTVGNYGLITARQWSVKKAGVLVANYIPAKRNSDSVIGMYDTITSTFFTNAGTGTFTAGAENTTYQIPVVVTNNGVSTTTTIYASAPLRKVGTYADVLNSNGTITRNVGVKVLDGTENWINYRDLEYYFYLSDAKALSAVSEVMNTHGIQFRIDTSKGLNIATSSISQFSSISEWTAWLAAQYSAGTPVIVYYPLDTATTETLTSLPAIPLVSGTDEITVNTTVVPSSMGVKAWVWRS